MPSIWSVPTITAAAAVSTPSSAINHLTSLTTGSGTGSWACARSNSSRATTGMAPIRITTTIAQLVRRSSRLSGRLTNGHGQAATQSKTPAPHFAADHRGGGGADILPLQIPAETRADLHLRPRRHAGEFPSVAGDATFPADLVQLSASARAGV